MHGGNEPKAYVALCNQGHWMYYLTTCLLNSRYKKGKHLCLKHKPKEETPPSDDIEESSESNPNTKLGFVKPVGDPNQAASRPPLDNKEDQSETSKPNSKLGFVKPVEAPEAQVNEAPSDGKEETYNEEASEPPSDGKEADRKEEASEPPSDGREADRKEETPNEEATEPPSDGNEEKSKDGTESKEPSYIDDDASQDGTSPQSNATTDVNDEFDIQSTSSSVSGSSSTESDESSLHFDGSTPIEFIDTETPLEIEVITEQSVSQDSSTNQTILHEKVVSVKKQPLRIPVMLASADSCASRPRKRLCS